MGHGRGGHSWAWTTEAGSLLHQGPEDQLVEEAGSGQQARPGRLEFFQVQWQPEKPIKLGVTVT